MRVVVDFAEPVEGDPPVTETMTIRVATWRGITLGLYTHEFGPLPAGADPAAFRYLGHLSALQGALITDYGRALVPRERLDVLIPDEQEMPPERIHPDGHTILDGAPAQVWSTTYRGVKAVFGDPHQTPFVLLYRAHDRDLAERPELRTRLLDGSM